MLKNFQVFNSELDLTNKVQSSIKWRKKIKEALNEDRVIPVFQPIVNSDKKVLKYEVLSRIIENSVLISPSLFLEEAIISKMYTDLAIRIFEKAFLIMNKNLDKQFSFNLSYNDIFNKTLIDFLENSLKNSPNIAKNCVIEILETDEISDIKIMDEFLIKFRSLGVKIAIDDFGMGHSNLSHILHVKPDYIKIDGLFIKNIDTDRDSLALVKSVITLSKELNIKVIAEFVHSEEVFETLEKLGIDEYQGYYFSEPLQSI